MGISTQSKTKVNDQAASPEEKKTLRTNAVAGQEIEDLGGPTPQNYKSTDDSAKVDSSKKISKSKTKVNSGEKPAESGSYLKNIIWKEAKDEEDDEDEEEYPKFKKMKKAKEDDEDEDEDEEDEESPKSKKMKEAKEEDDEDDEDEDEEDEESPKSKKSKKSKKMDDEEDDVKEKYDILKKAAYKVKTECFSVDIKEDFDALTLGEELTETFKNKAKVIFESAVKSKINEQLDKIEETYLVAVTEEVEAYKISVVEKVDAFLNYICEEWLVENEIAIESGLKLEIAENFMQGIKTVFQESYVEIPEEKVSVLDELTEKLNSLETKLDEQIEKNVELNTLVETYERDRIIKDFADGLADSQKEKFYCLAEALNYDEETFKDSLQVLKESYFHKTAKPASEDNLVSSQILTESMDSYVKAISRWSK
jgi:hypothetical protein